MCLSILSLNLGTHWQPINHPAVSSPPSAQLSQSQVSGLSLNVMCQGGKWKCAWQLEYEHVFEHAVFDAGCDLGQHCGHNRTSQWATSTRPTRLHFFIVYDQTLHVIWLVHWHFPIQVNLYRPLLQTHHIKIQWHSSLKLESQPIVADQTSQHSRPLWIGHFTPLLHGGKWGVTTLLPGDRP